VECVCVGCGDWESGRRMGRGVGVGLERKGIWEREEEEVLTRILDANHHEMNPNNQRSPLHLDLPLTE